MNRILFWAIVALFLGFCWGRYSHRMGKPGQRGRGKLLSFQGGRAADSTASIESRPIPQGEDLPTAI